jgi:hypothetical protein
MFRGKREEVMTATWTQTVTDSNRIGEACWYRHSIREVPHFVARGGVLRMWAQCGDGTLTNPVAVVEDDETMICTTVDVDHVCFAAIPPWPKEQKR